MNGLLLSAPEATKSDAGFSELTEAQSLLKQMVLGSVTSAQLMRTLMTVSRPSHGRAMRSLSARH
jgi:hypothetical protein